MLWAAGVVVVLFFMAWWSLTQPLVFAATPRGEVAQVDPKRLEAHVRKLAEELHPRDFTNANLETAAQWIKGEFEAAGARVSEQPFQAEGAAVKNILGVFGPEEGPRVVIGAHYDAAGSDNPGADDNASGVAALIELAHALGKTKDLLKKRVELVAFTLEEPPYFRTEHMGSYVHAKSMKDGNVELVAMISLEMLGYFTDKPGSQEFPTACLKPFYPSKGNFIAVIGLMGQGGLVRKVKGAMKGASDLPVTSMNSTFPTSSTTGIAAIAV
jgi:hypothetical protein